jgi:hypothetical protein
MSSFLLPSYTKQAQQILTFLNLEIRFEILHMTIYAIYKKHNNTKLHNKNTYSLKFNIYFLESSHTTTAIFLILKHHFIVDLKCQ